MSMPIEHRDETCDNCRFWSEMLAQSVGRGIEARCLSEASPHFGKYTVGTTICAAWRLSDLGAIDTPGFDGTEYADDPVDEVLEHGISKKVDTIMGGYLANG